MIGKLTGIFRGYYGNTALIDVGNDDCCSIGYEVVMKNTDIALLNVNETTTIYIKEIIKEEDDVLYGFLDFEEKCWFEELIKLSGLGPKSALAVLSAYSCSNIEQAIRTNNCDFFVSINGIGGKIANRIPHEMIKNIDKIHNKIINFGMIVGEAEADNANNKQQSLLNVDDCIVGKQGKRTKTSATKNKIQNGINGRNIVNDAVGALVALGFAKNQIYNDVFEIVKANHSLTTEDIIKEFLKKK